jgi:hypothetical protein
MGGLTASRLSFLEQYSPHMVLYKHLLLYLFAMPTVVLIEMHLEFLKRSEFFGRLLKIMA